MSGAVKLAFRRPLKGLRPHRATAAEPGSGGTGDWLFDLRERAKADVEREAAFRTCLEGIGRALEELAAAVDRRLDEVAAQSTELGLALASEVLGAAQARGLADPTPTVIRCLRESEVDGGVEVFLAPDDLGLVLDRLDSQPDLREQAAKVRFSIDPELARGAVRMETEFGKLLYDPAEVLQRICDEVRRELSE